ncbi:MAG: hypothetical protein J0I41_19860 [Filimonas sp.]|nr:hypothetical protein [Filimonas sp.]
MSKNSTHIKLLTAILLICVTKASLAAFSGSTDEHKNKLSLKTLSTFAKNYSLSSFRTTNFTYKGSQSLGLQRDSSSMIQVNSVIQLEKGNTTYVFPYKYKIKVPTKFKTPTAPTFR